MKIRNKILFLVSMVLLALVGWLVFERASFVIRAEHTTGEVTAVVASNASCSETKGSGKSQRTVHYACTHFNASVTYSGGEVRTYLLDISAGGGRGHNVPLSQAEYQVGNAVPVIFDPRNPTDAYRDTFVDVWIGPIMAFIFQIGTFLGSLVEGRKRRV